MTVIYSNFHDSDTYLLRGIWEGLEAKVIEISLDDSGSFNNSLFSLESKKEEINRAIEREEDTLIVCGHGTEDGCL